MSLESSLHDNASDVVEYRHRLRHSASHLMADAVLQLFPEAKLGIGPPTADGFYYDFQVSRSFTPEDLEAIEARMSETIARDHAFVREELSREEARRMFSDQPYKLEIIEELPPDETISIYRHSGFVDLCRGPHVDSTGRVSAFKLLSIAGAYWRGDENRPMLQRIYGTAFETREALEAYLRFLEEAERRDHRRLGRELDLLSFHEEYGPGLVYWHPKGGRVRTTIEDLWRKEHYRAGYELVYSPHIGKSRLWETSGHLDFYAENMYSPMDVDGQDYYVKPMNCPFHIQIYKSSIKSYRELPIRLAELGTVYRYERSGVLHGLLRVRGFTQDDAHIFCRPDQVRQEIEGCVDFMQFFLRSFGFRDFHVYLSTRDQGGKFAGSLDDWDMATGVLRDVIQERGLPYDVDEGGAVFYGPKIDVKLLDALGREWQCTTIQFDFNLPERFDVSYIGEDGREHRPYMVHRALLGSIERFFGVLIEHYAGAFPVWLAPVQAVIIPIADRHLEYARMARETLAGGGIRVDVDSRSERMNAKIRNAQMQKVPYMLVVGDKEVASESLAVRLRSGEDLGPKTLPEVSALIQGAVHSGA
ncbi:MAG: threonine--tRNA ligase [Chloroflexi bacterium]|nr:threonine--tRNA ligase [Chloroflexota bacterium]